MAFDSAFERIRARVHNRAFSYQALFLHPQPVRYRWWQAGFWRVPEAGDLSPVADVVLRDLAAYCYANKPTLKISPTTQQTDALAMAFAEGRRDTFNRITAMCNLTSDQIDRIAHHRSHNDE